MKSTVRKKTACYHGYLSQKLFCILIPYGTKLSPIYQKLSQNCAKNGLSLTLSSIIICQTGLSNLSCTIYASYYLCVHCAKESTKILHQDPWIVQLINFKAIYFLKYNWFFKNSTIFLKRSRTTFPDFIIIVAYVTLKTWQNCHLTKTWRIEGKVVTL